jgi:ABC-type Fe3+-siderophore transport system permease subunit
MKPASLNLALLALLLVLFVVSLLIGPAALDPVNGLKGLFAGGDEAAMTIMREVRLPRALLAAIVGFSLGLSGAALQGFLRNPLAEPGIIGVSASAALGAVIIFWLLGSIKDRSMAHVWIALPLSIAGWALILACGRALDALSFGEEAASSLGVAMGRARVMIVVGVALCVGAGTAVTGAIGFVGLVVPHLIRPLTDRMPSRLLLPSGIGGAALLTAADIAARVVVPATELNVGVLTALIGAPFFLWLVIRSRREAM